MYEEEIMTRRRKEQNRSQDAMIMITTHDETSSGESRPSRSFREIRVTAQHQTSRARNPKLIQNTEIS